VPDRNPINNLVHPESFEERIGVINHWIWVVGNMGGNICKKISEGEFYF
jgi:hypothetical protein